MLFLSLLFACQSPPPCPSLDSEAPPADWLVVEGDCPAGGLISFDRLGEPLQVVLCEPLAAYCGPVGYGLTQVSLTVLCPNGGLARVVWGVQNDTE